MRVRIYQPTKTAMQSGRAKTDGWLIEPELVTARTPEPLMGWSSAGDTFSELRDKLRFGCVEDAVAFAKRNEWDYFIEEPAERRIRPRSYMDNFRIVRPQDEEKSAKNK